MIFVAHIAIATTAVQLSKRVWRYRRPIDLRMIALVSILPDLIDKPLAFMFPEFFGYNTRLYAHSLLFCILMIPALIALRRRLGPPMLCWLVLCSHIVLDQMWVAHETILYWPLLGEPAPQKPIALQVLSPLAFAPEAYTMEYVGLIILAIGAARYRLYEKDKLLRLLKTGQLD